MTEYLCSCGGKLFRTEDEEYGLWKCIDCGKLFDSELITGKPMVSEGAIG